MKFKSNIEAQAKVFIGDLGSANATRFPNALSVTSVVPSGVQHNESLYIGSISEALSIGNTWASGIYGVGYTNSTGTGRGTGVTGEGHVSAAGDTGVAVGVRGYAIDAHTGNYNIGLYGDAENGDAGLTYGGNVSLFLANGNIVTSSAAAKTWYLGGNLIFNGQGTAKTISVTNGAKFDFGGTASQLVAADGTLISAGTGISISGGTISSTVVGGVTSFNTRTGAVTLTSGDVTTALGYAPVTNARTLTINGVSYDLSANRSWTVSGTVTSGISITSAGSASNTPTTPSVNIGMYVDTYAFIDLSTADTNGSWIDFSKANGTDYGGRIRYNNGSDYFSISAGANEQVRIFSSNAEALGSFRAPIFYDSNNTAYYLNPNGQSIFGGGDQYVLSLQHSAVQGDFVDALFVQNSESGGRVQIGMSANGSDGQHHRASLRAYKGAGYLEGTFGIALRQGSGAHTQRLTLTSPGDLTVDSSMRAPTFYDSNNTAYYGDFASTSNFNQLLLNNQNSFNTTTPGLTSYGLTLMGGTADYANGIIWTWGNTNAQAGVYVQSSGAYGTKMYLATTDSFATGAKTAMTIDHSGNVSLNRGTFSNGSVWINNGANNNAYNENIRLFNAPNGVSVIAFGASGTSGTPQSAILGYSDRYEVRVGAGNQWQQRSYDGYTEIYGSSRAPLFYDSNNTGYYVDPASTSNCNVVNTAGYSNANYGYRIFRNIGNLASWQEGYHQLTLVNSDAGYVTLNFHRSGYTSNNIYYNGNFYVDAFLESNSSLRAPIFYDSNNTGYYADPAGTSNFATIQTAGLLVGYGQSYSSVDMYDGDEGTRTMHCNSNRIGFLNQAGSWGSWSQDNGNWISTTDMQSPIFYDYNNTGYYVDPSNISVMYDAQFGDNSNGNQGIAIYYGNQTSGYGRIRFYQGGSNHSTIHSFSANWQGGGFGTTNSAGAINIDGAAGVTFGSWNSCDAYIQRGGNFWCRYDVIAYSDARVKDNVEVIPNALDKISKVRGVTFTRNDYEDKEKRHTGVIAQELLKVLPEAVTKDSDGMYSVSYGNLAGLFIEAIKEQQTQIEELKELVNKLINK